MGKNKIDLLLIAHFFYRLTFKTGIKTVMQGNKPFNNQIKKKLLFDKILNIKNTSVVQNCL